jgi:BlaI family transcriptional regulator, penicillinase repressor
MTSVSGFFSDRSPGSTGWQGRSSTGFAVDIYGKTRMIRRTGRKPMVEGREVRIHVAPTSRAAHAGGARNSQDSLDPRLPRVGDLLAVVNEQAEPPRAYTSVMSLLNVMTEKRLVMRQPHGRAFLYAAASPREHILRSMLRETLERVYSGSASLLVAHLLDQSNPSGAELKQIRSLLDDFQNRRADETAKGAN